MFITGNIFHFTQIEKFLPDTPQMRISTNKISITDPEENLHFLRQSEMAGAARDGGVAQWCSR